MALGPAAAVSPLLASLTALAAAPPVTAGVTAGAAATRALLGPGALGPAALLGLAAAILLGLLRGQNAGLLALLLAYGVGALLGGLPLREVAAGFPTQLLLTLLGLTLLFTQARLNGTLERLAGWAVQLCRGRVGLVPVLFFWLAAALGTLGAGNIGAVALLAPVAMAAAGQLAVPPLLMAICVATGGNAAALSPLSPTGAIAASLLARAGLPGAGPAWAAYRACLVAHALLGLGGYLLLGGLRLLRGGGDATQRERLAALLAARRAPLQGRHYLTLGTIALLLLGVAALGADLGALALLLGVLLTFVGLGDEERALRELPWGTILMVCGMMTLVALCERSGGTALLTGLLGGHAGPRSVLFLVGLLTGLLSAYSSSAGVVLPAFLPLVPGLAQKSGAAPLALVCAICVGAHLVDVSPLSTLGALCLSHAPEGTDRARLYRQLLAWGMAMAFLGGLYCLLIFGVLRLF